jgi:hypothetical protein
MEGQEVQVADSDLVEVVKRNGEFRKWGWFWGPVLYWMSIKAAKASRPRSFLWSGLVAIAMGAVGLWIKYAT